MSITIELVCESEPRTEERTAGVIDAVGESEADDFDALLDAMHAGTGPLYAEAGEPPAPCLYPWEDEPGYMESLYPFLF